MPIRIPMKTLARARVAIGLAAVLLAAAPAVAEQVTFRSPREALNQGISAYNGGYYELAIPALKFAAGGREFMANYYLARIYSDNQGPHTNHAAAYDLFRHIADEFADVDPDDDPRAFYVGRSLTALAGYVLRGLPEIGLKSSPDVAAEYLNNASATFNDEDAQFELAKLQLKGEGVELDVPKAKHWLATLSRKGHAGAQAFLADLYWRGMHMDRNQGQALALIALAASNAPQQDRLWIEDIYQNIYCGAGDGIRRQASGIVAGWGDRYSATPKPETVDRLGLSPLNAEPVRSCENGEPVRRIEVSPAAGGVALDPASARSGDGSVFMRGGASGSGLRDVGVTGR